MIYHYRLTGYLITSLIISAVLCINAKDSIPIDLHHSSQAEHQLVIDKKVTTAPKIDHQEEANEDNAKLAIPAGRSVQIRVLLDAARDDEPCSGWRLMAKKGFVFLDQHEPSNTVMVNSEMVMLHRKNGSWYLDNKKIQTDRLVLRAQEGSLMVDGITYYGSLFVAVQPNSLLLINCLDLEDYVFSVLSVEGFPGWPLEMNKVQAIAIRTYAAAMIYKNSGKKSLYHIKNWNIHQCYKGKPNSGSLRAAVDQTRGIILTYENVPIIAMYDICCGGIIPANMRGIDFKLAPFLARTEPCTYCKDTKEYRWQVNYPKKELEAILKEVLPRLGKLRDIYVLRKDKAGIVREVEIVGTGGVFHLNGKKFYSIIKGMHSKCFTIEAGRNNIVFKGRGYGHLQGMCQEGANAMVKQGATYRRVLFSYYPGTRFMKIKEKVV